MSDSLNLLLIDDNRVDADLLRDNLEEIRDLDCHLDWVDDFESGLSTACRNAHDIVLVDHFLGPKTGSDLIREAIARGCLRPLILYSGKEDVRMGVQAISQGASDYLVKEQIDPFVLEKTLRGILERDRILRENSQVQARLYESQRLESLGLMAGGFAHNFNNILNIILANVELSLQDAPPGSNLLPYLADIRDATIRAAELTGHILTFSGRRQVLVEELDMPGLLRETLAICRAGLPRPIRIESETPNFSTRVLGDPVQIRQVLTNLVQNAADSISGAGTIRVSCETRLLAPSDPEFSEFVALPAALGSHMVLRVEDTGCGIPAVQMGKIFDPFYSTREKGRGLGLASVLGIVRSHRGGLRVRSRERIGTCIEAWLPIAEGAEVSRTSAKPEGRAAESWSPVAVPDSPRPSPPQPEYKPRVLVVDDEIAILQALRIILQLHGFEVVVVDSAQDAREELRKDSFDLALVDVLLKDQSGISLYREWRRQGLSLPVVFTSGYHEGEELTELVRLGNVSYLRKPFSQTDLLQALTRAIAFSRG